MNAHLLVAGIGLALLSAAPPSSPEDWQREADAAFSRGDLAAAEHLYAAAAERSSDPGLVAFNRGVLLFARGEFRDAETHFRRCLADTTIPPERRANALYNLGTSQLRRGTASEIYRSAVENIEAGLRTGLLNETVSADARHNLELAKLHWAQARLKDSKPDNPNDPPLEEKPERPPPKPESGPTEVGPDAGTGPDGSGTAPRAIPFSGGTTGGANAAEAKTAGSGSLPVLTDTDGVQKLTPEDTHAYLARIGHRLTKDRRDTAQLVAGPDRKNVRDW